MASYIYIHTYTYFFINVSQNGVSYSALKNIRYQWQNLYMFRVDWCWIAEKWIVREHRIYNYSHRVRSRLARLTSVRSFQFAIIQWHSIQRPGLVGMMFKVLLPNCIAFSTDYLEVWNKSIRFTQFKLNLYFLSQCNILYLPVKKIYLSKKKNEQRYNWTSKIRLQKFNFFCHF